jgi:hypothetical protein
MNKNLSVEPNKSINPVLQAALSSLDVQLEEELARYRRQKLGRPVTTSKGLGRHQTRKPLDLIAVERVGTQPQRPALGMSTAPLASFPLFNVQPDPEAASNATTQQPQSNPVNVASASPGMVVAASGQREDTQNHTTENSDTPHYQENLTPPEQPSNLATVATPQAPPEDYLESSEQLLKSLAQEEITPPPKKTLAAKLLTPLGIGSILLLLLSGATAAFILSNPSSFAALKQIFGSKTPTPAPSATEPTSMMRNTGKDTPAVNGPDLATDEFVDLNLNTLSHLETSPKTAPSSAPVQVPQLPTLPNGAVVQPVAPTVVPNNALPKRAADLSSVLLTPSPQGNLPYTPIPKVAPLPTPASKSGAVKSKSTSSESYRSFKTNTTKSNQAKSTNTAANKSNNTKSNQTKKTNTAKSNTAANKSNKSSVAKSSATSAQKTATQQQPVAVAATPVGIPGYYYVLLDSNNEKLLEQARTIVPDAYVEKFPKGLRIQMGAFPTETEAKTLIETLQQQGLAASIYHP